MPRPPGPRQGAPTPEVRERLARAANLRAEGRGWAAVAEELGVAAATAQAYPRRYPKLWASALRRAYDQSLAEAAAEAVLTLRRLLRSDDDKLTRDAAGKLVQFAARRLRPPGGKPPAAKPPLIAHLEGMTADELTTLARRFMARLDAEAGDLDAGTA